MKFKFKKGTRDEKHGSKKRFRMCLCFVKVFEDIVYVKGGHHLIFKIIFCIIRLQV